MSRTAADPGPQDIQRHRGELLREDNVLSPVDGQYWIESRQRLFAQILGQGDRNDYARSELPMESVLDIEQEGKQLRLIPVSVSMNVELRHLEPSPFIAEHAMLLDETVVGIDSFTMFAVPRLLFLASHELG